MPGNFLNNDLDTFLNVDDFASVITYTPQPSGIPVVINGIFDNGEVIFDANQGQFISSSPQIVTKTSYLSGIRKNDLFQVQNIPDDFYVLKSLADGTGITNIYLSKSRT